MKTQFLTNTGCGIVLLLSSLTITGAYAVPKDSLNILDYQDKTKLTGKVSDSTAELPGVYVMVKESNIATITDIDGNFSIEVAKGQTLLFSMMGYASKQITYTGQSSLNIKLTQEISTLDEVVINAGYYSVKDRERTGSIARVTAKDIEVQPINNPLQALQGRAPGVNITNLTGIPGGGIDIEIRGQNFLGNKLSGRNTPFYVIDGVPFISDALGMNNGNLSLEILSNNISPLNAINPDNIESIEILKDADATAIYGSRGANGVVLITTKKGHQSKTSFTLSSSTSFSKVGKYLDMMNTQQYIKIREEAYLNGNREIPASAYDINGTWDKNRYTNWQKKLIGDTATGQEFSLGVRGGNEFSNFNINYSHSENTTVFPTDKGYKRNSALLSYNYKSKDSRLSVNSSTTYSNQSNNLPITDLTKQALTLPPNAPSLYKEDGSLNRENNTFINPLAQLKSTYENKTSTVILNSNISYSLLKDLYTKLNIGYTTNQFEERKILPHTRLNPAANPTSERSESSLSNQNQNSFIIEPQLNYVLSKSKHQINSLLGFSYQQTDSEAIWFYGKNFSSNAFIKNIGAAKEKTIFPNAKNQYKYASIFTRVNYSYNSKYFVNLTARRDGSSRFGNDYKFGNFAAVGAAWIFSKENFAKSIPWLSFGKLRTSYGITGSDNIGDYAYLNTYSVGAIYNDIPTLKPTALFNPNYKWEKTKKFEIATELNFFKNRLNTSIAYYNNRSSDQLVGMTLPTTTGFSSITGNSLAVVENQGWEFAISSQNIKTKDFSWYTSFNISFTKNRLLSYPGLEEGTESSFYVIGKPINIVKLYKYEGLDPETGNFTFKDYSGDGKITSLDKQHIVSLTPKFFGGFQNTITYKNFSLDFLFYFIKTDNYNLNRYYTPSGANMVNVPSAMANYHSESNPNATYMPANISNPNNSLFSPYIESTATISDASYIRLKNVALSYTLKMPKLKMESVKLYLQGQNLWTITSYKGMDPEFISFGGLPPLRTISFGALLTF
ncbi:SusC/RagA family TonB-linked outer membrane protein [Myroides odoratimimus]|uniref:SusC/RagA family TonB-linked outer membrane protein n=1 Tax=Myroides odoratimimus TaxID=76832 RepID=UPI002574F028|nr:SusC/RagA family TonB-linked outer membrane protein [Myroides odoratimimus]MDM1328385.1 SusC/RagA family TonB-linked outer membrane protein [Myroides odoratimimus]